MTREKWNFNTNTVNSLDCCMELHYWSASYGTA